MKKAFLAALIALPLLTGYANAGEVAPELELTHKALFDLTIASKAEVVGDSLKVEIEKKHSAALAGVMANPGLQLMIGSILDLGSFTRIETLKKLSGALGTPLEEGTVAEVEIKVFKTWLEKNGKATAQFHQLPEKDQRRYFQMLLQSRLSVVRRIARSVRGFHLSVVYDSPLGFQIAGIPVPVTVNPELPKIPVFKTHLKVDTLGNQLTGELDYIIVGSGASGSVIASQLAKAGRKVLVIEKGNLFLSGSFEGRLTPQFVDSRTSIDGSVRILTGSAVGGGTAVNGDIVERLTDPWLMKRFTDWQKSGVVPAGVWSKEKLLAADSWIAGQLDTRQYEVDDLTKTASIMRNGATRLGNVDKVRFYSANRAAAGDLPFSFSDKINAADRLLVPAVLNSQNPVTLLPNTKVTRVLFAEDGVTAIGVEMEAQPVWANANVLSDPYAFKLVPGTKLRVLAKNVVVTAGPLGTTAVLKNSGLDNPNIGRGLIIHPTTMVSGIFGEKVDMHTANESPIIKIDYRKKNFSAIDGNFLLLAPRILPATLVQNITGNEDQIFQFMKQYRNVQTVFMGIFEESNPENRVVVDAAGNPQVHYAMNELAKKRYRFMISEATKTMLAAGAKSVVVSSNEDYNGLGTHDGLRTKFISSMREADAIKLNLDVNPNQTTILGLHVISGNTMGASAKTSVVNGRYEVWGKKNLFVADSSVFPGSTGTHPMQSIYSIAKIFADQQTDAR